ncbi:MAG: class I SAM-dependent methyltransferase [Candidatus Omnitrophica bacterium]|nr:class I SAM-dependent methyltransferase [Candidatus Omnitrophota bacterium]
MFKIIKDIENCVSRYYLFSQEAIISRKIRKIRGTKTCCDLGCGDGAMMSRLKKFNMGMESSLGIDIHFPTLRELKNRNIYRWVVCADLRNLPLKDGAFDVAIASHVVEHIEKEDDILSQLERVCKSLLIVGVPRGVTKFSPHEEEEENVYQRHKSGYEVKDFKDLGYSVYGFGARFICNRIYKEGKIPIIFRPGFSLASQLFTAFTYFVPGIADCFISLKYKGLEHAKRYEK